MQKLDRVGEARARRLAARATARERYADEFALMAEMLDRQGFPASARLLRRACHQQRIMAVKLRAYTVLPLGPRLAVSDQPREPGRGGFASREPCRPQRKLTRQGSGSGPSGPRLD